MQGEKAIPGGGARGWLARLAMPDRLPKTNSVPLLDRRIRTGLWVLLVLFSFHGVFGHSLWGGNETREGGMIWDMVRNGTYVTPTINGIPFLEKPPLLHWTGVAICRAAGRVTEGLVRLPAALYGFGTLVLLVLFVRGPRSPGDMAVSDGRELAAWAAAFLCGTAVEFQEYARIVLTDMALVFVVTLSLFLFWRAYLRPGTGRWLAFLLAAAGAFYAKGLIGPALIWASVGVFLVWKRRFRLLAGLSAAYVPLLLILVLPWVAALYRFGGEPALRFAFWDNQVGRFFTFGNQNLPHDPFFINKEPWYYYLLHVPPYLAPWTLLLVPAGIAWVRRGSPFRTAFHVFVASSLAGMALVLQISSAKVASYTLPLYPMLFVAVSVWFVDLLASERPTLLERWTVRVTGAGIALLFGLVSVVLIVGALAWPQLLGVSSWPQATAIISGAVVVLALVAAAAVLFLRLFRSSDRPLVSALGPAAYVVVVMGVLQLVTPVIDEYRSYKPIATLATKESGHGVAVALGTGEYRDVGAFTFYLDRRLPILKTAADIVSFLRASEPRAVLVPVVTLSLLEPELAEVPHTRLFAGEPRTLSREYALLENRAGQIAAGRIQSLPEGMIVVATTHAGPSSEGTASASQRKPWRRRATRRS
ncbi:MAG: phospholipid carrier-dependent glycosyltransferase [Thermoanaerobaculaceae bacterium]|jgi:4-amino-4-deoxy-L-arabinose transferase-like glycosyltransferase